MILIKPANKMPKLLLILGEYYWANKNVYKGDFVNGLRHGHGVWKGNLCGGDDYEGSYRNDK